MLGPTLLQGLTEYSVVGGMRIGRGEQITQRKPPSADFSTTTNMRLNLGHQGGEIIH
jgi:hypothetical protein